MTDTNTIDLHLVLRALNELGIPASLVGEAPEITKVCSLLHKEPHGLYYFTGDDPAIFEQLRSSVVLCNASAGRPTGNNAALVVEGDVQLAFYRLCAHLFNTAPAPGVHPTAVVHPEAVLGANVHIGAYAVIGKCVIGAGSVLLPHVVVGNGCVIGERVRIEPHGCIGATGVVWVWGDDGKRVVLPQLGGVHIGDDVFLGADVSIVRGILNESTTIGSGTLIAPGTKVGHSVVIEADCHLANNVSIAGSARIGARSFLGSGCSVRSHAKLAQDTIVGAGAVVVADVVRAGLTIAGVPAVELEAKGSRKGVPRARASATVPA
ncbi:MAG TPA: DapH/DapD/GlmU-related protein [Flavobacteriales bacterium]|jgi:UDP-3-O-[3-hydroxymyristoyl] glucosamine N-acyltransferase|nr:DapH/DapD/GlmU-related protein [Flavobacteriales bacterium]